MDTRIINKKGKIKMTIDNKFIEEVAKWHKQAMPHATLATQLLKLNEEVNELSMAGNDYLAKNSSDNLELVNMELADVLLCCFVLSRRFNSGVGTIVANGLLEPMSKIVKGSVFMCIKLKHDINKARKWQEIEPGVYKHAED